MGRCLGRRRRQPSGRRLTHTSGERSGDRWGERPWWAALEADLLARGEPLVGLPDVPTPVTRRDRVVLARLMFASHGIASGAPVSGPSEVRGLVDAFGRAADRDWLSLLVGLRERIEADRPPFVVGWESWIRLVGSSVRSAIGVDQLPALRLSFAEEWPSADLTPAEAVATRYLTVGPQLVPAQLIALSATMAWEELAEAHEHLLQDWWVRARLLAGASSGHPWVDADRLRAVAGPPAGKVPAQPALVPGEAWWRTAEAAARDAGRVPELPSPGTGRDRVHHSRIRWLAAGAHVAPRAPALAAEEILRSVRFDWPKHRVAVLTGLREILDRYQPSWNPAFGALGDALATGLLRHASPEDRAFVKRAFAEELCSHRHTRIEAALASRLADWRTFGH